MFAASSLALFALGGEVLTYEGIVHGNAKVPLGGEFRTAVPGVYIVTAEKQRVLVLAALRRKGERFEPVPWAVKALEYLRRGERVRVTLAPPGRVLRQYRPCGWLKEAEKLGRPEASGAEWTDPPDERTPGTELVIIARGTTRGVVSDKGEQWIDVTSVSGRKARYVPDWSGGEREEGGVREQMRRAKAGDRVEVTWIVNDHLRAVEIRPRAEEENRAERLPHGAAMVTLKSGHKFLGKMLEADEKKVRVRTAFASLELKRSQVRSIEGSGGAPVARKCVDFFASVPPDGREAGEMQEQGLKFAGGFHKEGEVSGTAVRGLRCGEKFVLTVEAGGRELGFCVSFMGVGEHSRRSIYDPKAVQRLKRLRPGQEVELGWHNGGNGWLWMESPGGEVELPEGVGEILEGLDGRDWRNSIGRLASQVDPREAALVLSDIVDSNRGANVALDALVEVLQRTAPDEVPEEAATSLVFGLYHPYDNGIRVKCARALGLLRLAEAEGALRDCVAVRPCSQDGKALEEHKRELHEAVAEALGRMRTAPRVREMKP